MLVDADQGDGLALGPGAETRAPMALTVIGGIVVSTVMTLFVVPAAYELFDKWFGPTTKMAFPQRTFKISTDKIDYQRLRGRSQERRRGGGHDAA